MTNADDALASSSHPETEIARRRTRLLVISHSASIAGAELALIETLRVVKDAYEVHVVLPDDGPLVSPLEDLGIRVHQFRLFPAYLPASYPTLRRIARTLWNRVRYPFFTRFVSNLAPDVVLTNTVVAWHGPWAAGRLGIPHVWYLHEMVRSGYLGSPLLGSRAERALLTAPGTVFLANSNATADHYATEFGLVATVAEQAPRVDGSSVNHGVRATGGEKSEIRFGIVGTVEPAKAQMVVVEALALLPASLRNRCTLTLLGRLGPDEYVSALLARTAALGLEDQVALAGFVEEPAVPMAAFDAVIAPSPVESFGRATVEAMLMGVPVVGANVAGTRELIGSDERGLAFRANDASDLARALAATVMDPVKTQHRARQAQSWARARFTQERFGAAVRSAFDAAISMGQMVS